MLTRKQKQLLDFIDARLRKDGIPPSFEEMKDELGLRSKSGIHRLISALEERGFIRRLPHKARAIEIIRRPDGLTPAPEISLTHGDEIARVPLMGRIAAGVPIEAIRDHSDDIPLPPQLVGTDAVDHFALEVQGDSMIEAGILDGDIIIVRRGRQAVNGDIVVALIDGEEATLKKYRRRGAMIALEPANPNYETRVLPEHRVDIQGKLAALLRRY